MSRLQVVFPICDFTLERDFNLYEDITDDMTWSVVEEAIRKLYGGLINPASKKLTTQQVSEPYIAYDASKTPFENTCYELLIGGNKVNYFFVREYRDE